MDKKPGGGGRWPGEASSSSSSPGGRLPSFKKKRDLTLGENKKKFVPNLNVQRIKKEEPTKGDSTKPGTSGTPRGKQNDSGAKGAKDKSVDSKARSRPELIQTAGSVFQEGVAAGDLHKRKGGASWSGGGSARDDLKPRGITTIKV